MKSITSIVAVSFMVAALISMAPPASFASDSTGKITTTSSQTPNMFEDEEDDTETDLGTSGEPGGSMDAAPGSEVTSPDTTAPAPDANTDMEPDSSKKRRLRNYAVIKGGLYTPSRTFDLNTLDPQISNGRAHFQTEVGFAGELAIGHYLLPILAIEFGAGYFQSTGVATTTGDTMVRVVPLTFSAKVCLPLGPFEPYGLAGIGAYITDLDTRGNVGTFKGKTDVTYGMDLGAGFDINFHRNKFLGLEGKYLWAEPSFGGQRIRLDGFITTINLGFRY